MVPGAFALATNRIGNGRVLIAREDADGDVAVRRTFPAFFKRAAFRAPGTRRPGPAVLAYLVAQRQDAPRIARPGNDARVFHWAVSHCRLFGAATAAGAERVAVLAGRRRISDCRVPVVRVSAARLLVLALLVLRPTPQPHPKWVIPAAFVPTSVPAAGMPVTATSTLGPSRRRESEDAVCRQ